MTEPQQTPPGYYPHPQTGIATWWDGYRWNPQATHPPAPHLAPNGPKPPPRRSEANGPLRGVLIIILVIVLLGFLGNLVRELRSAAPPGLVVSEASGEVVNDDTLGDLLATYSPRYAGVFADNPDLAVAATADLADGTCDLAQSVETKDELTEELAVIYEASEKLQEDFPTVEDYVGASGILVAWRCPGRVDALAWPASVETDWR